MINADRIRALSDEGLATFIDNLSTCPPGLRNHDPRAINCYNCWLEWLKDDDDWPEWLKVEE